MILNLIILRIRPRRSAKLYQSVWTEAGSPLMLYSQGQVKAVKERLAEKYGDIPVVLGMRYGNPSMASAIKELTEQNVRDIIVLPLYPQYAGATTGSTFDAIAKTFTQLRWVPELQFINGYHKSEGYLDALCSTIKRHIEQHGQPDRLVFSYHGTPERYLKNGDPYHCFCHQTTRLVREKMGLDETQVMTTFQSRFGREPWLQPYTDKTLEQLPEDGVKHVAVICPGFSSDCLETIEEINMEGRESFIESGGEQFHYIPCLNDEPAHIDALVSILEKRLALSH
jgi:ferrochelatase